MTTTTSALVRAVKLGMIAMAALLVAGSIATSMARPAAKNFLPSAEAPQEAALNVVQAPVAQVTVWRDAGGEWSTTTEGAADALNDGVVPVLLRFDGVEAGKSYTLGIRYRTCDGNAAQFDALTTAPAFATPTLREFPGPGRDHPDSMIAIPAGHAVDAGTGSRIALWGGTFTSAARGAVGSESCAADAIIALPVRAQANHLVVTLGGHVPAGSMAASPAASVYGFISLVP